MHAGQQPGDNPGMLPRRRLAPLALGLAALPGGARAQTARERIEANVQAVLPRLQADNLTRVLGASARAVLVFPRVTQGGLILGIQGGEGALVEAGQVTGLYRVAGVSLGAVVGFQRCGLASFLMTERALAQFRGSRGGDVGLEARLVGGNAGLTDSTTLGTLVGPAYAITFDEQGLLLSLALEGMKVSPIDEA